MDSSGLSASTSLDKLRLGGAGRVVDIAGDDTVAIRLLEMGLTPGVTVRVVGKAPFGDPLELELRSYRLSIRRAEAARVTVQ
jgi:ferrous iron transport protein A